MIANYHTHTYRCGHAEGSERDYAEEACKAGLRILGFSDHTPYAFLDEEPRTSRIRMKSDQLPQYAETVRGLTEEYRDRLEIHLGVEAEYYPRYFPRLLDRLRENGVEYMILGQHFLGNEIDEPYNGRPFTERKNLDRYVAQTMEALDTGLFTYFAHPDLIHFVGSPSVYEREMRKLCRAAKDRETPLEINLLGIREGRQYPNERFWRIAAEEGNAVILGSDAHRPEHVTDPKSEAAALALAEQLGLTVMSPVSLRSLA